MSLSFPQDGGYGGGGGDGRNVLGGMQSMAFTGT